MRYFSLSFSSKIKSASASALPDQASVAMLYRSLPRKASFARGSFIFPCGLEEGELSVAAITAGKDSRQIKAEAEALVRRLLPDAVGCYVNETGVYEFLEFVEEASCNGFVDRGTDIFRSFGLSDPYNTCFTRLECDECFIPQLTAREIGKRARAVLSVPELEREVSRILSSRSSASPFSPVHYIIATESEDTAREAEEALLAALMKKGRVSSSRIARIAVPASAPHWADDMSKYLEYQRGGTVIYTEAASAAKSIPGLIKDNCISTLFLMETGLDGIDAALSCYDGLPVVVLREERLCHDDAARFLLDKARKSFPDLAEAEAPVLPFGACYSVSELEDAYRSWHYMHLCRDVHPEYKGLVSGVAKDKGGECASALMELDGLCGLKEVKETISDIVAYASYERLREARGVSNSAVSLHMAFIGNPGTAKTSVARLLARIFKEKGVLPRGELVEAGRADLVDVYLGGTAPKVRKMFDRARGGVLFIDEAYSLLDDREGLYGDEAISTIVQEMENRRNDTVVIFAGYPGKMETFLKRNPGLMSRIPFTVRFPDYSPPELEEILRILAKAEGFGLAPDVSAKVQAIFETAMRQPGFGNGRFVRNLFERAKIKAVRRLLEAEDLNQVLIAEDFSSPVAAEAKRPAGFSL